jgi:hypothetical protein
MARDFNGSTDQIFTSAYPVSSAAITLSVWFNPSGNGNTYNGILIHNSTGFVQILMRNTRNISWYVAANATISIDPGPTTLSIGQWYHLAFTYDSTNGLLTYINGASDGTVAANGNVHVIGSVGVAIGWDNINASRNVPGSIADAAEWNIALSSSDIAKLVAGVRPPSVQFGSCVGYWPLDGYASPEPDLSGNGNNGTLTGTSRVLGPPPVIYRISA